MQRREYIRRAKRWAGEMVLQGLEPSTKSLKMLLLGCSSTGDTESVQHWFKFMKKRGHKMGRFEYNAVIGAHGNEGYPHEASMWMERMRAAGFAPDARTYASLVDAWERIGNRQRMLQVMREYQDAEEAGELGEPLDPRGGAPLLRFGPHLRESSRCAEGRVSLEGFASEGHPHDPRSAQVAVGGPFEDARTATVDPGDRARTPRPPRHTPRGGTTLPESIFHVVP